MYRKKRSDWSGQLEFILKDLICLQVSFVLAYILRHGWRSPYAQPQYEQLAFVLTVVDCCVLVLCGSYIDVLGRNHWQEFKTSIRHTSILMGIIFSYLFLIKASDFYSRETIVVMWLLHTFLSFLSSIALKRWIHVLGQRCRSYRSVLLITDKARMEAILDQIEKDIYRNFAITGIAVMDADIIGTIVRGIPVVASASNIRNYIRANVVNEVFINMSWNMVLEDDMIDQLYNAGVTVHLNIAKLSQNMTTKAIERLGDYTVLTSSIHVVSSRQLFFKRVMDICGGVVGVILTGVLVVMIAPVIYIQSPGPIFFSQERVGKNGRTFRIYKFRSMYPDAEARKQELMEKNKIKDGMMFKVDNDPRIFPFGHFIRKHSLDEFPQFWNVLKGEMSLVGTRPPTVDEYAKYDFHHLSRLSTKPGLTGLWQVSGRSDVVDFEKVVRLDTEYISEWSLGLDVRIVWETVKVVISGSGGA